MMIDMYAKSAFQGVVCHQVMAMFLAFPFSCWIGSTEVAAQTAGVQLSAEKVFEQRIMPIFRSPNPSSCVQCHLASIDLKEYIRPSHEQTFLSLRDEGLVDPESPRDSKILELIRRGEQDPDSRSKRLHAKTREAELSAFTTWIVACCENVDLVSRPKASHVTRTQKPSEVIQHGRRSRVVDDFAKSVWSQRMRCFPCHTPNEIDLGNPKHEKPAARHRELVAKYGQRMNLFRATPEETMQQLIVSSRKTKHGFPMLNLVEPAKSLLILKPTAKLPPKNAEGEFTAPSSKDPVSHMGGLKIHVNDHSYKSFVAWIQDYANVVEGRYRSVDDLPPPQWIATQSMLRMKDCPDNWPIGTPMQLFVHPWDAETKLYSEQAIAFTQGTVSPRRIVNGALFRFAEDLPLAAGKHQIRVYVDLQGTIATSPESLLGDSDHVGHIDDVSAHWREGFAKAEMVSAIDLVRDK